ncbi:MAG: cellulase family glycosylhydrolase [Mycobacterium kyogaense]|uniref:cellulase family glycosylhydrolase n=1 Tax=Mycobacterium kyogaense TaxID=2212479 RepID=UPI002FF8501C
MRGSAWVGRAGALAVALGIGAAIASTPCVAFADSGGSEADGLTSQSASSTSTTTRARVGATRDRATETRDEAREEARQSRRKAATREERRETSRRTREARDSDVEQAPRSQGSTERVRMWLSPRALRDRSGSVGEDPVSPAVMPLVWGAALTSRRDALAEKVQLFGASVQRMSLQLQAVTKGGKPSPSITVGFPQGTTYLTEGDSGPHVEQVTVQLSGASKTAVTVGYTVSGYTGTGYRATAGTDFVAATGSVVFAPGQTSATIPITVVGDTTYEPDEIVRVELTSAVGALIVRTAGSLLGQTNAVIADDDPASGIGMTLHLRGADAATVKQEFDLMAAMGVTWVRIDMDWSAIQPTKRRMDWSQTDLLVNEAVAHQMNVLVMLGFTPAWARSSGTQSLAEPTHARPSDLADFAKFAQLAAQRYAPLGVSSWEVWNEPNTEKFWPTMPDADEYGRLFRAAATAIRGVDPRSTLLIGGLSPQYDGQVGEVPPATYLEQLYANGTAQLADAIAVHPYSYPYLSMDPAQPQEGGFYDLPAFQAVMASHGDGDKQVWITEFGAPTGTSVNAVSEQQQTAIMLGARDQVALWDWAGPLIYYELVDGGTNPADGEQNFGVLRADLTLKAVARALMDAAAVRL